jgi:hypothetical protein
MTASSSPSFEASMSRLKSSTRHLIHEFQRHCRITADKLPISPITLAILPAGAILSAEKQVCPLRRSALQSYREAASKIEVLIFRIGRFRPLAWLELPGTLDRTGAGVARMKKLKKPQKRRRFGV